MKPLDPKYMHVHCPRCGAEPGKPCKNDDGAPHNEIAKVDGHYRAVLHAEREHEETHHEDPENHEGSEGHPV